MGETNLVAFPLDSFVVNGVHVDPSALRLSSSDGESILEPKVMALLAVLCKKPGELRRRDELIDEIWPNGFGSDESLSRLVSLLRKAFSSNHGLEDVVKTVPKLGYRLDASVDFSVSKTSADTTPTNRKGSMPSLAVLPFTNRSRIKDDEIFAEGMVEDIIAALSQSAMLKVMGSMSTVHLTKGSFNDYASVAEKLGVTYLMEGNVRRTGREFSVTTQLLNAATGQVVWTGKFAKPLDDLQDLQEQLVTEVASALDTKITVLDMERALRKPDDITAWEAVQRSLLAFRRMDAEGLQISLVEARRAVDIAPDFAIAHAMLAHVLASLYFLFIPDDQEKVAEIKTHIDRSMQLNPHAEELIFIAHALSYIGHFEEGVARAEEAYALAPNNGLAAFAVGVTSSLLDEPEQAGHYLGIADNLMPGSYIRVYVLAWHANALAREGRWKDCEAMWEKCLLVDPLFMQGHLQLSLLYWREGRQDNAGARIRMMKASGIDKAMAILWIRRIYVNNPLCEEFLRIVNEIWSAIDITAND